MKPQNSLLYLSLLIALLFGCKDDDDDPYSGIPSGNIVEIDLRDAALVGSTSSSGRLLAVGQKWWLLQDGEIRYQGSCEDETQDIGSISTYYGFYSSNLFYTKSGIDGTPEAAGSWQWEDTNTKEVLLINSTLLRDLQLKLRALNDDELVYLSEVNDGDCTTLTWQSFGEPVSD